MKSGCVLALVTMFTFACGQVADEPSPAPASASPPPSGNDAGAPFVPVQTSQPDPPPPACGTRGGITCGPGQYCRYDSACGTNDSGGFCAPTPDGCEDVYEPVCGCDRKTYGNDCEAAAKGVSVMREGACGAFACGLSTCDAERTYCLLGSNGQGVCEPLPTGCTQPAASCATCFPPLDPCVGCPPKCTEKPVNGFTAITLGWEP